MRRTMSATLAILTVLASFLVAGVTVAAPGTAAPVVQSLATACRPNPSPPPPGQTIMEVWHPLAGQPVASPIRVVGQAIAFEAQFAISLYDQNGNELTTISAHTAEGQVLSPYDALVPYRVPVEQDGCLWVYNRSGKDGSPIHIVQVPVRLTTVVKACFREVQGTCIEDGFRDYWVNNGGLYQFGFPLAPGFREVEGDGNTYWVQYFERARFEYHPEHTATPYVVLLGLLGNEITTGRRGEAPFVARPRPAGCAATAQQCAAGPNGNSTWFAPTGHYLGAAAGTNTGGSDIAGREIARQWATKGGLPVYGYPISEVFSERGYDNNMHWVQYFERHRLEYHPANPAPYDILLGQLGRQIYEAKYLGR